MKNKNIVKFIFINFIYRNRYNFIFIIFFFNMVIPLDAITLAGWPYRRPITLNPNTPVANYQIQVTLTNSNFDYNKCQSDGSDIRFANSAGKVLSYWIDTWNTSDTSKIRVKVPNINCSTIYILYGNFNATSESDAINTFDLYEDFSSDSITATSQTYNYKILGFDGAYHPDEKSVALYGDVINPVAIYSSTADKTFIIYQTKKTPDRYVARAACYNHTSNEFSETVLVDGTGLSGDAHGVPSITLDSDGYLYVFYGTHGDTIQYYKKSANPYDISSWGNEQTQLTDKKGFTYPQVFFIDDTLHMFFREGGSDVENYRYMYYRTISHTKFDGAVWTSPTVLTNFSDFSETKTVSGMYHITYVNPTDNSIHIAYNWFKSATATRYHLYYMKSTDNGKTWTKADGTSLNMPVDENSSEKILDSGSDFCNVCLGDIQTTSNGNPLILFNHNKIFKLARWNGSEWIITVVKEVDHNFDYGTLIIDSDSQYRAYITVGNGRGGAIKEYLTTNCGVNWTFQKIIVDDIAAAPMQVYNSSSDKELEMIFCGGEGGNRAVGVWGTNGSFSSTITTRILGDWQIYESDSGTVSIDNEQLKLNGYYGKYSYLSQDIDINSGICMEAKVKVSSNDRGNYIGPGIRLWWDDNNFGHNIGLLNCYYYNNWQTVKIDNGGSVSKQRGTGLGRTDYNWYRVIALSDSFYFDISQNGKDWTNIHQTSWKIGYEPENLYPNKISIGRGQHYYGSGVYDEFQNDNSSTYIGETSICLIDNIKIRKYGSNPPVSSVGNEELNDSSLPVELTYFVAEQTSNSILLEWQTASELENLGFIIEKKVLSDNKMNKWNCIADFRNNELLKGQGNCSNSHNYKFIDHEIKKNSHYSYRIADIDYQGIINYHKPITILVEENNSFSLSVYPNPTNYHTHIAYKLENTSKVKITIFNIIGEEVKLLYKNPSQPAGNYNITWDGTTNKDNIVTSGTYLIQLEINGDIFINKVQFLK